MEDFGRYLNVVDVEATCWEGRRPQDQVSEIIEIGLCVVDLLARERVEKHRILVRPERSRVSEFCTQLTGLTQDEVDTGISFPEACALLEREHSAHTRTWASWGDYDRKQFERQTASVGVRYPFGRRHVNTKALWSEAHGLRRKLGMAGALEHAGLPLEGRHHSGADDAWNIAALVLRLVQRDDWPTGPRPGAPAPRSS
ncbi:3'-5' exonuclease [Actinomadura rupiterrae]|uniref:3'-5' exonuclease n=1 Tax=Actinomadura rupiterrae TaxID=559627 RepID=UPI0020A36963|nr:3'-5' exonuclease [Actinomadura rupiterrae]MCP2339551.1 inhibitor of KinA sporulation pathway (predicted exonuclease) [Actinomadura rupiterrae]